MYESDIGEVQAVINDMEPYVYQTLLNEDSIRVLTILTSTDEAEIRCSLDTTTLQGGVEYATLSYTWGMDADGDSTLCRSIAIDGRAPRVTRNLYDWLRRVVVTKDLSLPVWIDAICINQANVEERGATVARMADIYEGSKQLFVWLGQGNDSNEDERIQCMLECMGFLRELFDADDFAVAVREVNRLMELITSRRYWTRRWIIQEHAFGDRNEVTFMWGPAAGAFIRTFATAAATVTNAGWREIDQAFHAHVHSKATSFGWLNKVHPIQGVLGFGDWERAMAEHGHAIPPGEMLSLVSWFAHDFQCSDPRDIVYALQSLGPRRGLRPDYRMTTAEVFAASCADQLNAGTKLQNMLYSATTHRDVDDLTSALPSWCPDLRQKPSSLGDPKPLGPCRVRPGNILDCTLVYHGVLENTNTVAEAADPGAVSVNRAAGFDTMALERLTGEQTQVGDLVCGFSRDERNNIKIILRKSGAELSDVRLIASGRLHIPARYQDKHHLIALSIH
ncbi:hypothetical protein LTR95_013815 [Oleoguttula sp. CCFEE 5521]